MGRAAGVFSARAAWDMVQIDPQTNTLNRELIRRELVHFRAMTAFIVSLWREARNSRDESRQV